MLYTRKQAEEFFKAWREASIEVLDYYNLPTSPGHKTRPWKRGHAVGVTEHFTAGVTWKGSISWLSGGSPNSSCHAIILDRRMAEVDAIFDKYGLDMPVLSLLLADLDAGTWHATWSNGYNFGIENRNAGPLKGIQGAWTWWANKWTKPFPYQELNKTPINIDGKWWEPYTYGQIMANITICQMLYCLYEGDMDRRWFIPHQCISKGKMDTGRAFPLDNVRDAVFDQVAVGDLTWLHSFKADPMYMDDYDEEEDLEFLKELAERQGDRSEDDDEVHDFQVLEQPPDTELQLLVQDGNWRDELPAIRRALHLLGYHVPASDVLDLDKDTALAVWMFQTSYGGDLTVDKIPGGKTQAKLYERLKSFGLTAGRK
jgi:N-acetyl-anhydromuramyl-L-alanine amidase AmpD